MHFSLEGHIIRPDIYIFICGNYSDSIFIRVQTHIFSLPFFYCNNGATGNTKSVDCYHIDHSCFPCLCWFLCSLKYLTYFWQYNMLPLGNPYLKKMKATVQPVGQNALRLHMMLLPHKAVISISQIKFFKAIYSLKLQSPDVVLIAFSNTLWSDF